MEYENAIKKEEPITDANFEKMKMYIISLENTLHEKEGEIDSLNKSVFNLKKEKVSLMTNMDKKDNVMQEMSTVITNLTTKQNILDNKIKDINKQNEDLNYKIIELSQKNKSLNENAKFFEMNNNNLKEYIMQIAKLSNKLDELEISKAKLEFDKNNLVHQINDLKTQNETEMKLFSFYKSNEISQYQKTISSLQSTINELNNVNLPTIEITSTQTHISNSNLLLDQISSLENQITKLNEDNFTLLKQNQSLKSEIEEKNIKLNHKENIITSLQKELNNSIEEFKYKLNEAQVNSEENFNQNKETQSQLEQLILERDELIRKNEELKKEYLQFNKSINEASQAFAEKCEKFQSAIGEYKTKIKNYKEKIHNLKAKVNELIEEINRLKQDNKTVCEVLENIDNTALNNYKSDNNLLNNKNDIRRKSGTHSYAYSPSGNNEIHSIYKKDDIYSPLITNISGKPKPMLSTSYFMRDPLEENQKKALEDYKKVLTKVDFNLKQFTTNNKYMDYN